MKNKSDFTVLMSVYYKEKPEYLNEALNSIFNQTLLPNQVVIVEDGPLTDELDKILLKWKEIHKKIIDLIKLDKNGGLGNALNEGIKYCKYNYIARMDTDDIARNDRFEKQIEFLKEHTDIDLVGSWISEFETNPEEIISYRQLPTEHNKIYQFGQFRCPVNHMTVVYRKEAVLKVGNYQKFKNIEDYYLWGRMLKQGCKFANIPECLVNVRAGKAMLRRRANLTYFFNSEFPLHTELYKIGFINKRQYLRNICSKFLLRVIPFWMMKLIYEIFLRKKTITV